MLRELATLTLMMAILRAQYSPGCLKHVNEDSVLKCEICDLSRFFYAGLDGKCAQSVQADCEVPSLNVETSPCFRCKRDYFLDELAKACVPVPASKKQVGCRFYSPVADCIQCEAELYVSEGKCVPVNVRVDKCVLYDSAGSCGQCDSQYRRNAAGTECRAFETTDNCRVHSDYACSRCKSGFFYAFNVHLLNQATAQRVQSSLLTGGLAVLVENNLGEECVAQNIQHCQAFDSYGRCQTCADGYYSDRITGKCLQARESPIFKCKAYMQRDKCRECEEGLYIVGDLCRPRTKTFSNCKQLTPDSETCQVCEDDWYIDGGACIVRVKSIHIFGCQETPINMDVCSKCKEGMLKATDDLKCFFPIPNCAVHKVPDSTGTLECTTCHNETIPQPNTTNTVSCVVRNKPSCKTFLSDHSEACFVCHEEYYKSGSDCLPFTKKCKQRSTSADECLSCYSFQYLKTADKTCHNYTAQNCSQFNPNEDKCANCDADHYLDSVTSSCLKYNLFNCSSPDPNKNACLTCAANFVKISDTRCEKLDIFGCANNNSTQNICHNCMEGFYKDSSGVCHPQRLPGCTVASMSVIAQTCSACEAGFYLKNDTCHQYTVTRCKPGKLSSTDDQCTECQDGFHKTAGGKCIPLTQWNCNAINDSGECTGCVGGYYLESATKQCVVQAKTGCSSFDANSLTCNACKAGFYKDGSGAALKCLAFHVPNCQTPDAAANTCTMGCKTTHYWDSSKKECLLKDLIGCDAYTISKNAQTCMTAKAKYFKISGGSVVPVSISNCYKQSTTDDSQCELCVDGHYLDSTSKLCVPITTQASCLIYLPNENKCKKCKSLSYPDSGSCTAITSTAHCVESDGVQNQCSLCKPNRKIDGANCSAVTSAKTFINCKGNAGSDQPCSVCNLGHRLINMIEYARELPYFCGAIDTSTGACTQAREGFECASATDCFPIQNQNSVCIKLMPSKFTGIDVAASCAECRNPRTHFLDSDTCKIRTAAPVCGVYSPSADDCIACREGLSYNTNGTVNNDCSESEAADNSTHCRLTAKGAKGCYECEAGYVVNDTSKLCVTIQSSNEVGCRTVSSATSAFRCSACIDGFSFDSSNNTCVKKETCYRSAASPFKCELCWKGFVPHPTSDMLCVPKLWRDDCLIHSVLDVHSIANKRGACVRCKDSNRVPYNYWDSSNNRWKYHCRSNAFPDLKFNVLVHDSTTLRFKPVFMPWDNAVALTAFSSTNAQLKPLLGTGNLESTICLDIRVPGCKLYSSNAAQNIHVACTECDDGHFLSNNSRLGQECVPGRLSGCQIYESQFKCKVCHNGFYLKDNTDTKDCVPYEIIPFCKVYESTNHGCAQCLSGYVPVGGACEPSLRKNCKHFYVHENLCFECQLGFYLSNYQCKPYTVPNCDVFQKTQDRCVLCKENYYLNNSKGLCFKNTTEGCQIRSKDNNSCIACNEGVFSRPDSNHCIEIRIDDCLQQDPESGKCLICQDGYYKTSTDTCEPHTLDNCLTFEPYENRCLVCQTGFYLNYFGTCFRHTLHHCRFADPRRNRCLDCDWDTFLTENGNCHEYSVRNCSVYQAYRDGCVSCLPGFYMNSSERCLPYVFAKNCLVLNPFRDECRECLPHHFMSLNHCYKYTVNNCAVFKGDTDLCVACRKGFFLSDNLCQAHTVNNCSESSLFANSCLSCHEGDYLEDGLCKPNTALFCSVKNPFNNTCLGCRDGFFLSLGVCLPRVKSLNCKRALPTADLCDTCFATHYKAAGLCISYSRLTCKTFDSTKDLCLECETGKYWMSNHLCEPYTALNCKTFNSTKDQCDSCVEGPFFLGTDKLCHASTLVTQCQTYNNALDQCSACNQGYYLHNSSECRKNPDGIYKCRNYSANNACSRCELGYYLVNNYCERSTRLIDNCSNYIADGSCGQCLAGFTLKNNSCFQNIEPTCQAWQDSLNCESCGVNMVLQTNASKNVVCIASGLENCLEASSEGGSIKCLTCVDGMFPSSGVCKQPDSLITGCLKYQDEVTCLECGPQFTLTPQRSSCFTNSEFLSANCEAGKQFATPVCKVCSAGYLLDSNSQCQKCGGEGCDLCDPWNTQQCLMCASGFDHDGTKCIQPSADSQAQRLNKFSENGLPVWKALSLLVMGSALLLAFPTSN